MSLRFLRVLKDSGKLSLAVTVVFFAGMLYSAYLLFTLPHNLTIRGGLQTLELTWPVLINLFIAIGLTFLAGIAAINIIVQTRKETVVYLEKRVDDQAAQHEEATAEATRDFTSFKAVLQQAEGEADVLQHGLNAICVQLQAGQGAIYLTKTQDGKRIVELKYGFALAIGESSNIQVEFGEGLIGQAAASGKSLYLDEVPEGYITIVSGLGTASPRFLTIVPIKQDEEVKGVLEIATFSPINENVRTQVEEMGRVLAEKIN